MSLKHEIGISSEYLWVHTSTTIKSIIGRILCLQNTKSLHHKNTWKLKITQTSAVLFWIIKVLSIFRRISTSAYNKFKLVTSNKR